MKIPLYTIEKLHQVKAEHEAWIVRKLKEDTDESEDLQWRIEEVIRTCIGSAFERKLSYF